MFLDLTAPEPNFKGKGIAGKGSDMVTKHDAGLSGRRNATKVYEQVSMIESQ